MYYVDTRNYVICILTSLNSDSALIRMYKSMYALETD